MDDTPILLRCDPPATPPGRRPHCDCFFLDENGRRQKQLPAIHADVQDMSCEDVQDMSCEARQLVQQNIEEARQHGYETLEPLKGLDGPRRAPIVSLSPSIGELTQVRGVRTTTL